MCCSSEMVGFFEKMVESNNGGLRSATFSKKHSKCLKLTLENHQKSGFYIVKFSKLQRLELAWVPQFFEEKKYQKVVFTYIGRLWIGFYLISNAFLK